MEPEEYPWTGVFLFPGPFKISLHLNWTSEGTFPLPLSRGLIQKVACLDRRCAKELRTAYHKYILAKDFSQVRISTGWSLSLWFPQIGTMFSHGWRRRRGQVLDDNKFWLTSIDGQHNCPFEPPDWVRNNLRMTLELDQHYHTNPDRPQVEVRTAMEAWEVAVSNRIPIIPDTVRPLGQQRRVYNQIHNIQDPHNESRIIVPTVEPKYHLASAAIFESDTHELFDGTGHLPGINECWLCLPYANYIAFYVSPEDMEQIITILEQKGQTYPRVKQLNLSILLLGLPNDQLAKLLILFPRLLCVDRRLGPVSPELNTRMIEVFGTIWHH